MPASISRYNLLVCAIMETLWSLLRCPACGDSLSLEIFQGEESDPQEGLLRSQCSAWFPIINRIPRIFTGEMRSVYRSDFGDFLEHYRLSDQGTQLASQETRQKL